MFRIITAAALLLTAAAQSQDIATLDSLLAKLPARDAAAFNEVHAQLAAMGKPVILELADRMERPGSDVQMEYALSGLAKYVTRPGAPAGETDAVAAGLCEAVAQTEDPVTQAFLIQQLVYVGAAGCEPTLAALLDTEHVGTDARMLLEVTDTDAARAALGQAPDTAAPEVAETPELTDPGVAWTRQAEQLLAEDETEAFDLVLNGMESENDSVRAAAFEFAAKEFEGSRYTSKLERMAKRGNEAHRAAYLTMLGQRGDEDALNTIDDFIDDNNAAWRRAAIGALIAIGGEDANEEIEDLFDDADEDASYRRLEADLLAVPGGDAWVSPPDDVGFQSIFNGENHRGWWGFTRGYAIEDGALKCESSPMNMYTIKEYDDFAFRFEFKLTPGANNGIGLRAPARGKVSEEGMESQILDNTAEKYADLKPYQFHGSIYGVLPAEPGHLKPVGEWNEQGIKLQGSRVTVTLNGHVILDGDLEEATKDGTMDGKEHPGLQREKGHLALLGHNDVLWFKNLRVKEL